MAESFVGLGGQRIFSFFPPPCAECRWRAQKRCSGPQTVQSQIQNQQKLLSCFEPERTAVLQDNLNRFRPSALPDFGIIQGLPASIPVLCEGMPSDLHLDSSTLYGIALDDLLDDRGRIGYDSARHLREAFRLPADGRLCLLGSVRDAPLEAMWHRSSVDRIWARIRSFGFEFVTGASFSVFEEHSRNGQLVSLDKNMLSVDLLAQAGLPVVPVFCEVFEEDLLFAVRWLKERPSLEVVAGLAQGWRTDEEFDRFVERMKFLKRHVPRPLHFLIIGCSSAARIWTLFRELGQVTVANTNLALSGVNGAGWDPEYHKMVAVPQEIPREHIIRHSFEDFAEFCETCAGATRRAA